MNSCHDDSITNILLSSSLNTNTISSVHCTLTCRPVYRRTVKKLFSGRHGKRRTVPGTKHSRPESLCITRQRTRSSTCQRTILHHHVMSSSQCHEMVREELCQVRSTRDQSPCGSHDRVHGHRPVNTQYYTIMSCPAHNVMTW